MRNIIEEMKYKEVGAEPILLNGKREYLYTGMYLDITPEMEKLEEYFEIFF